MIENTIAINNKDLFTGLKKIESKIKSHKGKDSIKNYLVLFYDNENVTIFKTNGMDGEENESYKINIPLDLKYKQNSDPFFVVIPSRVLFDTLKLHDEKYKSIPVFLSCNKDYKMDWDSRLSSYHEDVLEKRKSLRILNRERDGNGNVTFPKALEMVIDGFTINLISHEIENKNFEGVFSSVPYVELV